MSEQTKLYLASGAAVAFALGLGFVGGRWTAEGGRVAPATLRPGAVSGAPSPARAPDRVASAEVQKAAPRAGHHDHDHAPRPEELLDPSGEVVEEAPLDLTPALEAARAAWKAPGDERIQEAAQLAAEDLAQRLLRDPAALSNVLAAFRRSREEADLEMLAAVLAQIHDPEVEALALDLALNDPDLGRRRAAFDILDGHDTPAGKAIALEVLARETDVPLRRAALRAVPEPAGATLDDARAVVGSLTTVLSGDPDPETRRRAAMLLGRWATDPSQLSGVVSALTSDPDVNVRAGAAFALEIAQRREPALVAALTRVLQTSEEDPLVRENAWQALRALSPLPPEAHQAYEAFRAERDAAGEVIDLPDVTEADTAVEPAGD